MPHVVLLGDSIFDNGRYVFGDPDVIAQVRRLMPAGWKASLLAVDGAMTDDVPSQVRHVPGEASHLVLSVGGNDALMSADILRAPAESIAQALGALHNVSQKFEEKYRRAVDACRQLRLPLTICTIYNGCFPDPEYQRVIATALMVFNDVILRIGIGYGLSVIDLRMVCSSTEDYANSIEPSSVGGEKIAKSIVGLVSEVGQGARVVGQ